MTAHPQEGWISGGSPTVFVGDMQSAVEFYTEVLGFRVQHRADDHYALIDAGHGLTIGLHLPSANAPPPGTPGAIEIGFNVYRPIAEVVDALRARGVEFRVDEAGDPIVDDGPVQLAFFNDPDGNTLYLCDRS
ncbi:MAG: VOC family protein [Phycisphaerae bacterium]|nr:VOC family protein [Phycisphaerae bacterium]